MPKRPKVVRGIREEQALSVMEEQRTKMRSRLQRASKEQGPGEPFG